MTKDEPQPADATDSAQNSGDELAQRPLLRVVKGDATPEEIAALVAVVATLGSGDAEPPQRQVPEWSAHHRKVRRTLPHGPGGWRSSGLPG